MGETKRSIGRRSIIYFIIIAVFVMIISQESTSLDVLAMNEKEKAWVEEASIQLRTMAQEREIMAVVYLAESLELKEEASLESKTVITVESGQTVLIQDVQVDEQYGVWELVSLYQGDVEYRGYLQRRYLACSDERFLAWEKEYGINPMFYTTYAQEESVATNPYADVDMFPESYRQSLRVLKEKHPNWIFVPMNTRLDWNTVIQKELGEKSLVHKSFPAYAKEGAYDQGSWFYSSKEFLELYMDPRNALSEDAIFQFEQLTYNETYHTEEALDRFLDNTFMKKDKMAPGTHMTYGHIIWAIGAEEKRKVSPFHLAARIYQEQGAGTSPLISGTYQGYEGYYNYFNVGASGKTDKEVIESGLRYAKNANPAWNNAYFSILGGADVISANYIRKGQDTLYLQKFNVNPKGSYPVYTHQYMQNIAAPTGEAKTMKKLYQNTGALDSPFVFKIPVYQNMPAAACPMPTSSEKVILDKQEGFDSVVYVDGVAKQSEIRNGRMIVEVGNNQGKSAVLYRYNENGIPVGMRVFSLAYKENAYVATEEKELEDLLSYHGFSIRIVGKSGIRCKMGIQSDLRTKLINEGVNGFHLKEYGTLIMKQANQAKYPMIKDGEKVIQGMSYGKNEAGEQIDKIYETVDGRNRYTAVLVGLPVQEYKTVFAFRGYIVLEKDGVETIVYGPSVSRSIYDLAKRFVERGIYPEGSQEKEFLQKIISDADGLEQVQQSTES